MNSSYFSEDTICSIVTGRNANSPVGIIRCSGPSSWKICAKVVSTFENLQELDLTAIELGKILRVAISCKSEVLDDGIAFFMKNPKSFTGEDLVEIHIHGNLVVLERVVSELNLLGARSALPGEFSFRAFRNRKISLDQAEAISSLIQANNLYAAKLGARQSQGRSKRALDSLRSSLLKLIAALELEIDFSDQGLVSLNYDPWIEVLSEWIGTVDSIRKNFKSSELLRQGIGLSLVGKPNSGKSTLFNAILGEDRSIVSDEAGTTRDVVREVFRLSGSDLRISDTAGIRETSNKVEAIGVERALGEVSEANVALLVIDGFAEGKESAKNYFLQEWVGELKKADSSKKIIGIWNKCDVAPCSDEWRKEGKRVCSAWVEVSAKSGQGLDLLFEELKEVCRAVEPIEAPYVINNSRQYHVLGESIACIERALEKIRKQEFFPDLLSSDLRGAMGHLSELTGEFTNEEVLSKIFSEFCIGK